MFHHSESGEGGQRTEEEWTRGGGREGEKGGMRRRERRDERRPRGCVLQSEEKISVVESAFLELIHWSDEPVWSRLVWSRAGPSLAWRV